MQQYLKNKIVKHIEYELEELYKVIPEYFLDQFKEEAYVAGGSLYSIHNNIPISDIDIFIETLDLKMMLLDYFKSVPNLKANFSQQGLIYVGTINHVKLIITDNAITIGKFQIILKDYGSPKEVIGRFDFKHNMHYVKNGELHKVETEWYLNTTKLLYNEDRARDIVSTIMRVPKMLAKGFEIEPKEMAKMLLKLNEVGFNSNEISMLSDKLITYSNFGS